MSDENKKFVRLNERESLLLAVLGLIVALFFGICFLVCLFDSRSFMDSKKPVDLISTGGYLLVGLSLLRSSYKRKFENWAYAERPKKEISAQKQGLIIALYLGICFFLFWSDSRSFVDSNPLVLIPMGGSLLFGLWLLKRKFENCKIKGPGSN